MKLYTEQQVIQMIEKSRETGLTADYLIATRKGIELPSDEEIDSIAPSSGTALTNKAFKLGAKWMRDKIQGGKQ